jgi:hypothetical protein
MGNDGKLTLRGSGVPETKQSCGQRLFRDVTTRNVNLPYIMGYVKNFNVLTNLFKKLIHLPS